MAALRRWWRKHHDRHDERVWQQFADGRWYG